MLPEAIRYEDARDFLDVTPGEFEEMRKMSHPSPLTGIAHEFTYYLAVFETHRRLALHVLEEERKVFGAPGDLLVLFRIVDKTSTPRCTSPSWPTSTPTRRRTSGGSSAAWSAAPTAPWIAPSATCARRSRRRT